MFSQNSEQRLMRLRQQVLGDTYRPGPILRFSKKKTSGGVREITIWCLKDRVLQTATHQVLSPYLEPKFEDSSFAYRPGRSVSMAGRRIMRNIRQGYVWIAEGDIRSYFDNVPHGPLLKRLYTYVPEPPLMDLVSQWLEAGTPSREYGLPQGAAISPILANLYLDEVDEAMADFGVRFVRYADDFVMMCRSRQQAQGALQKMARALSPLGLWLHPDKTRISHAGDGFMFLGRLFSSTANDEDGLDADERDDQIVMPISASGTTERVDLAPSPAQMDALVRHFDGQDYSPPPVATVLPEHPPSGITEDDIEGVYDEDMDFVTTSNLDTSIEDKPGEADYEQPSQLTPPVRTLYIMDRHFHLSRRNKAFTVEQGGQEVWARATSDVDRIDIGPHVGWDKGALDLALTSGTTVNFVSGWGDIRGTLVRPSQRAAGLQLAQARHVLDPGLSLELAGKIVQGKINNQHQVAKRWQGNLRKSIANLSKKNKVADPSLQQALVVIEEQLKPLKRYSKRAAHAKNHDVLLGIEGDSAKRFYQVMDACLRGWAFKQRTRRPARDPVNAVLNWVSTMLVRDIDVLVRGAGLHAGFGILHATQDRRQACIYDLVEEFRAPVAEVVTLALFNQNKLGKGHFYVPELLPDSDEGDNSAVWMTREGRSRVIRAYERHVNLPAVKGQDGHKTDWRHVMKNQVRAYVRHIRGVETYQPYRIDF